MSSSVGDPVDPTRSDETFGIACPACGARNAADLTFCRVCAHRLVPDAAGAGMRPGRRVALRFMLGVVIGATCLLGGLVLVGGPSGAAATQSDPGSTEIKLADAGGVEHDFVLRAGAPKPLTALPATSTLQLASYAETLESFPPGDIAWAPWWNPATPRVPAISQFDRGGPLQGVNCVMAAGAMLARLAYGIVTTGSQLRALQADQEGATNFQDLENAVERGWGVRFLRGSLSALQLRALSYNGAGIVVSLDYSQIPAGIRLATFTGGHAVYVDAFRPAGPDGPAAYYVMDPIGHPWSGYKGGWWPAADLERAALIRGGGLINATWAFAAGRVPQTHKLLPPAAYPSPLPSGAPPGPDPMPTTDLPVTNDKPTGDPPPDTPSFLQPVFTIDVYTTQAATGNGRCTARPTPSGCPTGVLAVVALQGVSVTPSPLSRLDMLYAQPTSPGSYQIIFDTPVGSDGSLWLWQGTDGALQQAPVQPAVLGGTAVSVATVTIDPTAGFSFFASATSGDTETMSSVGTLVVGQ